MNINIIPAGFNISKKQFNNYGIIFLLIICFASFQSVIAQNQNKIDSMELVLKNVKKDTSKIIILNAISKENIDQCNYADASKFAFDALDLAEKKGFKKGMAVSYHQIGTVYLYLSDYSKALENEQKSLTINEQSGNKEGIAGNYHNLARVYCYLFDSKNALEYEQ